MTPKINNLFKFVLTVVCTQFAFADNADTGGKQMYVSFEDAQAALSDKEYAQDQSHGDSNGSRSAPDWQDCPSCYEFTATISGAVILNDGVQMGGGIFAAFDDEGNVRGIALELSPPFGPYAGTPVFEMQMRSNAEGDHITFKYYDPSSDEVLDISEDYTFVINDIVGDVVSPWTLNIGSEDLSCPACEDNDAGVAPFTCSDAVASFGCDFLWGGTPIGDSCPASFETCPE